MRPVTPEELQFLYNLLLDNTQATVRQSVTAHDIMQRIALQLTTPKEDSDGTDDSEG